MHPVVSVCIPTYNRRALLEKTIDSLRAQSFRDYEVIVCNDASTDGTQEYLHSLKWPELKVLCNERNLNLPGSMTRLFAEARGKYVGMQHDHDLYAPDFIEKMVSLLESHPTAGFGCCAYTLIDDEGRPLGEPDIAEFHLFPTTGLLPGRKLIKILASQINTPIPAMGTIFRRDLVEKARGYRPDWYLAADEDLYRRVAAISDVAFCPERLFRMRIRPAERAPILGSWNALYTLYEFRRDTTDSYFPDRPFFRLANKFRLAFLYYKALLVESLYLWSLGDLENLMKALQFQTVRNRGKVINPVARVVAFTWIKLLSLTTSLGTILGKVWRARERASFSRRV